MKNCWRASSPAEETPFGEQRSHNSGIPESYSGILVPMLRLAVDEDFDQRIVLGLKRLRPDLDIVRAREIGLSVWTIPRFYAGRLEKSGSW